MHNLTICNQNKKMSIYIFLGSKNNTSDVQIVETTVSVWPIQFL